jgi:hypothetical protein
VRHGFTSKSLIEADRFDPFLHDVTQRRVCVDIVQQQSDPVAPTSMLEVSQRRAIDGETDVRAKF